MKKTIILLALLLLVSCCPVYVRYEVKEETVDRTPLIKEYLDSKDIGYCSVEHSSIAEDYVIYEIKAAKDVNVSDMMKAVGGNVDGVEVIGH